MGVGGGSVSTLVLMLYGTPIHVAVGDFRRHWRDHLDPRHHRLWIAGLPQQALMPPLSIGYVSLIGVVLMAPISAAMSRRYGARLAHRCRSGGSKSRSGCSCWRWRCASS